MFKTINGGKLPVRKTKYSACVDVFANEDVIIKAGETKLVPLGIKIDSGFIEKMFTEIIENPTFSFDSYSDFKEELDTLELRDFMSTHYLQLMLRSSLGIKGLILNNGIGVIDLDFGDQLMMIISNPVSSVHPYSDKDVELLGVENCNQFIIERGDRIGQIILLEHKSNLFNIESDVVRTGGFGSSGVN